ncbi:SulP family inorganic anion transporter [Nocardia sp. NRRL S-836]|uniref:SulP family inorganic anion transporter n=1 Tax=Nocardia sp. NRRL S-836 TaxID=1519492 RepID=UPI0006AE2785|nr:SulP family inorganic anion transporter [Nocardia sp. NRRL S-836]KOV85844.1 sulfate transporter [Nocardia sp. NRRL S-836]
MKRYWADLGASVVVFLVALPLCVGVAVASGVPAELGIVTGVVGGLVVGLLPGSSLQVSGPAAGLTVLVADAVGRHGIQALGVIVLGAGLVQVLLGLARCGRWFRAISPSVVQGMLAGIGLVLVLGQLYPLVGAQAPATTGAKIAGLVDLAVSPVAVALGVLTIVIMLVWQRTPLRVVPGVLVGVVVTTALAVGFALPVARIEVGELSADVHLPDLSLLDTGVIGTAVVFALVASAESLFSAAAVDRMHNGPRTRYNRELVAQGIGNGLCGLLGALPMTAVIVRSSANVQAGARTKLSRVLHGVWLLLFVVALPGLIALIPVAVLAAVLVHAGWKLLGIGQVVALWRTDRAEGAVLMLTAGLIVATDLLTGTLAGLLAAVVKTAWDVSRLSVVVTADGVALKGNATFLRLPRLLDVLDGVDREHVRMDLSGVRHLDQACGQAIDQWVDQSRRAGRTVELVGR